MRIGLLVGVIAGGCGGDGGNDPAPTPSPSPSPAPQRQARLWVLAALDDPDPFARQRAVLLLSDDLGTTWQSLADTGLADTATAFDFLDAEHGVAVGGSVAQPTDDGGRTWSTQIDDPRRTPDHLSLVGVQLDASGSASALGNVVNDDFLNASGYESYLLPPDGAAARGTAVRTPPLARLESMCVTASGVGVAAGGFRFTMALLAFSTTVGTIDGGAMWDLLESVTWGATTWSGTACAGEQDLWRFGAFGVGGFLDPAPVSGPTIAHSVDGGLSWDGPVDHAAIGEAVSSPARSSIATPAGCPDRTARARSCCTRPIAARRSCDSRCRRAPPAACR